MGSYRYYRQSAISGSLTNCLPLGDASSFALIDHQQISTLLENQGDGLAFSLIQLPAQAVDRPAIGDRDRVKERRITERARHNSRSTLRE
jgi:hypothetical protein